MYYQISYLLSKNANKSDKMQLFFDKILIFLYAILFDINY